MGIVTAAHSLLKSVQKDAYNGVFYKERIQLANGKMFMLHPYNLVTSAWYSLRSYVAATMVGLY
jgi:hypothetical protein